MSLEDLRSDVHSLLPGRSTEAGATRRTALQAALGFGYAVAAAPLMAQTAIATPADGLDVGTVHYEVNGFKVPAYRAAPAGKTGLPVVLVVQEIFGVHAYIADVCRRLSPSGARWLPGNRTRAVCPPGRPVAVWRNRQADGRGGGQGA